MHIQFLAPAELELDEAFQYYESEQQGLGFRFVGTVKQTLSRVAVFPVAFQAVGKYSRRCLIPKFPYGLIYQYLEAESKLLVVAVAHLHRRPDYWASRESQT